MIKNTIIVILLLLLLITFYAYMCLSNNMIDFQKERMEHILKKETEIKQKEKNLVTLAECNDNMNKYKNIISKLSTDLTKTVDDFNQIVKFVNQTNNTNNNSLNPTNNTENHLINSNPMNSKYNILTNYNAETNPMIINYINPEGNNMENFENLNEDDLDKPIE